MCRLLRLRGNETGTRAGTAAGARESAGRQRPAAGLRKINKTAHEIERSERDKDEEDKKETRNILTSRCDSFEMAGRRDTQSCERLDVWKGEFSCV